MYRSFRSPLSVGFHCWKDQCSPMLEYCSYCAVPIPKVNINNSISWNEPLITSVLFAGSTDGTIVAYEIISKKDDIIDIFPLCLVYGHQSSVTSIISSSNAIYKPCVASLSKDGTLSFISVLDLTIIYNQPSLFSEGSISLTPHGTNSRLMIAAQECGTFEIADIESKTIVLRVSGFSSIIASLAGHGPIHSVSTYDGAISVFSSNEQSVECIFSVTQPDPYSIAPAYLSPDLVYVLRLYTREWKLYDSNVVLFQQSIHRSDDTFEHAEWLSQDRFAITTSSGHVEIWTVDTSNETQFSMRSTCPKSCFYVSTVSDECLIESHIVNENIELIQPAHKPPTLFASFDFASIGHIGFTPEGFIVSSPGKSIITIYSPKGQNVTSALSKYFKSVYCCRCPVGDPVRNEVLASVSGDIYFGQKKIGHHDGVFLLFAPGNEDYFYSFSKDATIGVWNQNEMIDTFYQMIEPIKKVRYVEETNSIVCIGQRDSFCVINCENRSLDMLCAGHDSPIVNVTFSSGLYHARCESSSIFSWNWKCMLVSKRKAKNLRPLGALPENSQNSTEKVQNSFNQFGRVVQIGMPNCQTFAIVLDIFKFLKSGIDFSKADAKNDPSFLPLLMLWKNHVGDSNTDFHHNVLGDFTYALGGANFTVSLPIKLKTRKKLAAIRKLQSETGFTTSRLAKKSTFSKISLDGEEKAVITSSIAFTFSPLLSSIHSVASSVIGQCFVTTSSDDNLSLISALSQTVTAMHISNKSCVVPSLLIFADWLDFEDCTLRTIVSNVTQEIASSMPESEFNESLNSITHLFPQEIALPFQLIACKKYGNVELTRKIASTLGSALFKHDESVDILSSFFNQFVKHLESPTLFFKQLAEASDQGQMPDSKIITFALVKPVDFLTAFENSPKIDAFVKMFLDRWLRPERPVVLSFLLRLLRIEQINGKDQSASLALLTSKQIGVAAGQKYVVFGADDGTIQVFDRFSSQLIWEQKVSQSSPITYISISPNGQRFVVLVFEDRIIHWIAVSEKKADPFEMAGSHQWGQSIAPTSSSWIGETRIAFYTHGKKLVDFTAPHAKFFDRFKKK